MITIEGLTDRQRMIADLIWNCDTMDRAVVLINSLQGQDRADARAIMQCMIYEVLEEQIGEYKDAAEVAVFNARYS